jgi:mRNA interferase MazF
VIADATGGDWILCQVTSNSYADPLAVRLTAADFSTGSLQLDSYARPGKLFTAHASLIIGVAGFLHTQMLDRIRTKIVEVIQPVSGP